MPDQDGDNVADSIDNCPTRSNPDQKNTDGDHFGDACDEDDDNDGSIDFFDRCPGKDDRLDRDRDRIPDGCDPFPSIPTGMNSAYRAKVDQISSTLQRINWPGCCANIVSELRAAFSYFTNRDVADDAAGCAGFNNVIQQLRQLEQSIPGDEASQNRHAKQSIQAVQSLQASLRCTSR
jgi:hypothetical protein